MNPRTHLLSKLNVFGEFPSLASSHIQFESVVSYELIKTNLHVYPQTCEIKLSLLQYSPLVVGLVSVFIIDFCGVFFFSVSTGTHVWIFIQWILFLYVFVLSPCRRIPQKDIEVKSY